MGAQTAQIERYWDKVQDQWVYAESDEADEPEDPDEPSYQPIVFWSVRVDRKEDE